MQGTDRVRPFFYPLWNNLCIRGANVLYYKYKLLKERENEASICIVNL